MFSDIFNLLLTSRVLFCFLLFLVPRVYCVSLSSPFTVWPSMDAEGEPQLQSAHRAALWPIERAYGALGPLASSGQ